MHSLSFLKGYISVRRRGSVKKLIFVFWMMCLAIGVIACDKTPEVTFEDFDGSKNYVDVASMQTAVVESRLDLIESGFTTEGKAYNIMSREYYIDETSLHFSYTPRRKLNLNDGRIQVDCDIPGCTHTDWETCEAGYYSVIHEFLAYGDTLYYASDGALYSEKNGKTEKLFTNTYVPDIDWEDIVADNAVGVYLIKDDYLYLKGLNFFYRYHLKTGEISERYDLGKLIGTLSLDVIGDKMYITSTAYEFFCYDMENKTLEKLDDMVTYIKCTENKVYYCHLDDGLNCLYSMNPDGSNRTKLIDDCYVNFMISENTVYYTSFSTHKSYCVDLDGSNIVELPIEKQGNPDIITADNLNSVIFFYMTSSDDESYLEVVNKETKEVREIVVEPLYNFGKNDAG